MNCEEAVCLAAYELVDMLLLLDYTDLCKNLNLIYMQSLSYCKMDIAILALVLSLGIKITCIVSSFKC